MTWGMTEADEYGNTVLEWRADPRSQVAARVERTVKKYHTSPVHTEVDGWVCSFCEAEGFDKDLFNEFGEDLNCVPRGRDAGLLNDDVMAEVEVQQARKWIDQMGYIKTEWEPSGHALDTYRNATIGASERLSATTEELEKVMKKLGKEITATNESLKPVVEELTKKAAEPLKGLNTRVEHKRTMQNYHDMMSKQRMKGGR